MIKKGTNQIVDVKLGANQISKVLAGASLVWQKEIGSTLPLDNFNDGVIGAMWEQIPDPALAYSESAGKLVRSSSNYSQYQSLRLVEPFDFTGRRAQITFSELNAHPQTEQFVLLVFPGGKFIYTYNARGDYLGYDNFSGSGNQTYLTDVQDAGVIHRFYHDTTANRIKIETSQDNGNTWTHRHTSNALTGVDLTQCKFEIRTGNYGGDLAGCAFDDFIVSEQ